MLITAGLSTNPASAAATVALIPSAMSADAMALHAGSSSVLRGGANRIPTPDSSYENPNSVDCVCIHPADTSTLWIAAPKSSVSWSKGTTAKSNRVPLNLLIAAMMRCRWAESSVLGAFNFASSRLACAASLRATPASLFRLATSDSDIVCKWAENKKMPPSATNSPATPMITIISNFLTCAFHLSDLEYSPTSPITSRTPNANSNASDASSAFVVAGLDSERSVPISPWSVIGALGFVVQGLGFALIAYRHMRNRKP